MSVLTPQPILRHLLDRLYQNYVQDTLYSEADVLVLLNDAYLEACERSMCLRDVVSFPLTSGTQEYDLPADFSQAVTVHFAGQELDPLSVGDALVTTTGQAGYYLYTGKIGFMPVPAGTSESFSAMMIYAAKPAPLASYDDSFDPRYPVEFADILLHYVRWRVRLMSGGAESIQSAATDRQIMATRVAELRRMNERVESVHPPVFEHLSQRRPRLGV